MTETLNIDHHRRLLLEKALIIARSQAHCARLLGVSERIVGRMKERYGIRYDWITRTYEAVESTCVEKVK